MHLSMHECGNQFKNALQLLLYGDDGLRQAAEGRSNVCRQSLARNGGCSPDPPNTLLP